METKLLANIEIKHEEKLSDDDISNIEYFMKEGIEQIIDGSQEYEVKKMKVQPVIDNEPLYEIL